MTDLIRALDISYGAACAVERPPVFRAWCNARKVEGYEMLIVGCWMGNAAPSGAEEALRIARETGLLTAGYCVVHDGRRVAEHVHGAMEGAGPVEWRKLLFMAVDCEEVAGVSLAAETIGDALYLVRNRGSLPIIYTRGSYWRKEQKDTHEFASFPLWEAFHDGDADLYGAAASLKVPFGGFAEPIGKQYLSTTDLDGVWVDFSVFSRTFILGKIMSES